MSMPYFMRAKDRVNAERELIGGFKAADMSWSEVELFFKRMRISAPDLDAVDTVPGQVRAYLSQCSDDTLLNIAKQLGLDVKSQPAGEGLAALGESKYWLIDHFRVFISHVHTSKLQAGGLHEALQRYGISAFVAHEDIDTSDEWREEILRALMSMDAFVAILSPDFSTSKWTDQEVGVAVARGVLMIPIDRGLTPYGFLAKYQTLPSRGLVAKEVAGEIFRTISTNTRTQGRTIESLTRTIAAGSDAADTLFRLENLAGIHGVGVEDWERIRENIASNVMLRNSPQVISYVNIILAAHSLQPIELGGPKKLPDDEIPF
jgi:hypothetical protein